MNIYINLIDILNCNFSGQKSASGVDHDCDDWLDNSYILLPNELVICIAN